MAVLGVGGRLELKRQAPEPCLINYDSISSEGDYVYLACPGYWTGDKVSTNCLPLAGTEFPPPPSGWATYYGSKWFLGPNRDHITALNDAFYKTSSEDYPDGQYGDDAQFYAKEGDVSGGVEIDGCQPGEYWIHVDSLGRVSFYRTRCDAMAGCADNRVDLEVLSGGGFATIAPYGSLEYQNAIWQCIEALGEYQFSDGVDSITLVSICEDPPLYQKPEAGTNEYDNADLIPRGEQQGVAAPFWTCIAELREWTLQLDAPSVDTTSVAEKFGNAVKSLVSGGGSMEYLIDRKCYEDDTIADGRTVMQLLLMTEKGCQASARFWLIDRPGCGYDCEGLLKGDLYYEADILVTNTALNCRPTEILAGTANFVTTGSIRLLETP